MVPHRQGQPSNSTAQAETRPRIECSVNLATSENIVRDVLTFRSDIGIVSKEFSDEAIIQGMEIGVVSKTVFVPHRNIRPLTVIDADLYTRACIICLEVRNNRFLIREFLTMAEKIAKPLIA